MFKTGCFMSLFHPSNMANIVCMCVREGERERRRGETERERSNKRMRETWKPRNGED